MSISCKLAVIQAKTMHAVDLLASTKIATTWMPVVNDTNILGFRENQHFLDPILIKFCTCDLDRFIKSKLNPIITYKLGWNKERYYLMLVSNWPMIENHFNINCGKKFIVVNFLHSTSQRLWTCLKINPIVYYNTKFSVLTRTLSFSNPKKHGLKKSIRIKSDYNPI